MILRVRRNSFEITTFPNTNHITSHIVAYACVLIVDTVLLDRSCSGDRSGVPIRGAVPHVDLPGKQTPLFIPIQSHSLAPTLFYLIRTTMIQLLLYVAVVEPIPLHDLSLPQ